MPPPRYYHGGPAGRQRGAYVLPPSVTGAPRTTRFGTDQVVRDDRVFITTDYRMALLFAAKWPRGHVYEVEPAGDLVDDPVCTNARGLSFECEKARVVRVIKPHWHDIQIARKALAA